MDIDVRNELTMYSDMRWLNEEDERSESIT